MLFFDRCKIVRKVYKKKFFVYILFMHLDPKVCSIYLPTNVVFNGSDFLMIMMKNLFYCVCLMNVCFWASSCLPNEEDPLPLCSSPTVQSIRLNWVDERGNDLLFGTNAPYGLEDIRFKWNYNGQISDAEALRLRVDTLSDKVSVIMSLNGAGSLMLGDLSEDKLGYSIKYVGCASELESLSLNDSLICMPCTGVLPEVIIEKFID